MTHDFKNVADDFEEFRKGYITGDAFLGKHKDAVISALTLAASMQDGMVSAEQLAQRFHETYERLAPDFGYKTREASAKPWVDVPDQNKYLMIAVCAEILSSMPLVYEPTKEMLEAARDWSYKKYGKAIGNDDATGCYKAMIAATPDTVNADKGE